MDPESNNSCNSSILESDLQTVNGERSSQKNAVSLHHIANVFFFIGVTSFGGGGTAYIRRIIVEDKKWLTNEEFFTGLSFCQLLPGANVVGISLYIGNHLCGIAGAFIASLFLILPSSFIFFGLGYLYFSMGSLPSVEVMLKGAGAVACGLMASMFVEAAEESLKNIFDLLVFIITFLLMRVGHFHVPIVILMVAPVALWWYRPRPYQQNKEIVPEVMTPKEKKENG